MNKSIKHFKIHFKANEGYGDFITGLCYAHNASIKYQIPVEIVFHWPNDKNYLFSSLDTETIYYRFEYVINKLKKADNLSISHNFNSKPNFRYFNNLEHDNPLHGFWSLRKPVKINRGLVALWRSKYNTSFPGRHKDPFYKYWDDIIKSLTLEGYTVKELTYRTPIAEAMSAISSCEFGIGYEGMVHQLFKVTWRPLIVASERLELSKLLTPQASIVSRPQHFLDTPIEKYVLDSEYKLLQIKENYKQWLNTYEDPTKHVLYNKTLQ